MFKRLATLYSWRRAVWEMSVKQFRARYSASFLGVVWALVAPLLITLAVTFVFTAVFKVGMEGFAFFCLAGFFPWMFVSRSLTDSAASLLNQQGLLRQFSLPREILPLAAVFSGFLTFLIGWIVVYPVFVYVQPQVIMYFPLWGFIVIATLLFACGLGLLISLANVFWRDTGHFLDVLLLFWLWATPVFYSTDMVPEGMRWVYSVNPLVPFVAFYREVLLYGRIPQAALFLQVIGWMTASLSVGLWVFWRGESRLLKRI